MGVIWDIIKEIFPQLEAAVKGAATGARTAKRKRRNIFILKAITANREGYPWPPPVGSEYEFIYIQRQVNAAVVEETLAQKYRNTRIPAAMTHLMKDDEKKQYKKVAKKYNLPLIDDKYNQEKLEAVLHEMVDDKLLKFHPPSRWSIV